MPTGIQVIWGQERKKRAVIVREKRHAHSPNVHKASAVHRAARDESEEKLLESANLVMSMPCPPSTLTAVLWSRTIMSLKPGTGNPLIPELDGYRRSQPVPGKGKEKDNHKSYEHYAGPNLSEHNGNTVLKVCTAAIVLRAFIKCC